MNNFYYWVIIGLLKTAAAAFESRDDLFKVNRQTRPTNRPTYSDARTHQEHASKVVKTHTEIRVPVKARLGDFGVIVNR